MTEPLISAIVPNFNHASVLPRCVKSLAEQKVKPFEILVIDDASTDNSVEVLSSLAEEFPMLRFVRNEKNLGVNATTNKLISLARGDYLLLIGADDEVRPGVFETATKMLREHPDAGLCSGICEWKCVTTGLHWYSATEMPTQPCFLPPSAMVELARRGKLVIAAQGAVFKKAAVLEVGGYDPKLAWFADWFCAYIVGLRRGICYVPEVRATFYVSPTSYFNAANQTRQKRITMALLLDALETPSYADVVPLIRESGLLGEFGWQMVRCVMVRRDRWPFLTGPFLRKAARRCAEVVGRRFFPNWMAKLCLKAFYGLKK